MGDQEPRTRVAAGRHVLEQVNRLVRQRRSACRVLDQLEDPQQRLAEVVAVAKERQDGRVFAQAAHHAQSKRPQHQRHVVLLLLLLLLLL